MNPLAKIHRCLQGSEEWFNARRGRATASQASRIITAAKGDLSKSATGYALELIAELMAPDEAPAFVGNSATDRGNKLEETARKAFEERTGLKTEPVGFIEILNPGLTVGQVGLSPDSLILDAAGFDYVAGLELKCPLRKQHVENMAAGGLLDDYKQQIHWSLALTGLPEWHFFSFHPDMQPVHHVVKPDGYTDKVIACIAEFLREYAALRERLIPMLQLERKEAA